MCTSLSPGYLAQRGDAAGGWLKGRIRSAPQNTCYTEVQKNGMIWQPVREYRSGRSLVAMVSEGKVASVANPTWKLLTEGKIYPFCQATIDPDRFLQRKTVFLGRL
jgi:hypothetical protein